MATMPYGNYASMELAINIALTLSKVVLLIKLLAFAVARKEHHNTFSGRLVGLNVDFQGSIGRTQAT
jgi:hypothetical protein